MAKWGKKRGVKPEPSSRFRVLCNGRLCTAPKFNAEGRQHGTKGVPARYDTFYEALRALRCCAYCVNPKKERFTINHQDKDIVVIELYEDRWEVFRVRFYTSSELTKEAIELIKAKKVWFGHMFA